ncbi:putative spermidine/putrescine transport system permease protein [Nocardioides terrae]|uniref:Putative spermidine/putrescine transport system permease protein n=1 Tax=Nocardioides terrae TaxID=574651 RepID=A0A1I1DXJ4_9ACTN|nr:ABC transporter permease subunit [Nocardioides terrae]SFB79136.1 putative spermidine/putrescine transport system permease protein [Nocardioides terrae]
MRWVRPLVLLAFAAFFFAPLWSLLDFSTKDFLTGGRTGDHWRALVENQEVRDAIVTSLELAVLTVALMLVLLLPTMIWVRLRVPQASRLVEFLCLLPLTVPPLVIVVGINGVYSWVNYFLGGSALTLTFVYVVLVLPFAYRALDASLSSIDVTTLAEAARSLGAGWLTVIARVVAPNVVSGVLSAAFISVALVLGEFTFSSLMHFDTLPVRIVLLGKGDIGASMAASLATLLLTALLLVALSLLDRRRSTRAE